MKSSLLSFCLISCGVLALSPARSSAQENIKPGLPPGPPSAGERSRRDGGERRGNRDEPESVPTPFIGVITREIDPDVRAQTGLKDGYGLLVVEIMPDGPAKEAGLQQHDVLVKLDDQKLVNMEQLQVLVRSQKKGDEITLTIRRGGAEQQVKVRVGEKDMPPMRDENRDRGFGFPLPRGGAFRYEPGSGPGGTEWRERAERLQNELREYQRRMQEWSRGDRERPQPQPPRFGGEEPRREGEGRRSEPPPAGEHRPDARASGKTEQRSESSVHVETKGEGASRIVMHGNVIRTDDTGVYTIRRENDRTTFTVRTKDGKEKSWPINTEDERKAVPEQYREVLREMDKIPLDAASPPPTSVNDKSDKEHKPAVEKN